MSHVRKSLLIVLIIGLMTSSAMASSFTLWHMEARPSRVAVIQEVIDNFNQAHPEHQIIVEVQSWGDVFVKAIASLQAGMPPDFMFTTPDLTMNLRLVGGVKPVTEVVTGLLSQYDYFQTAVNPYYSDGEYWGIPLFGQAEVLWYRKDLFEKAGLDPEQPPRTWSEYLDIAQKLVASGVVEHPVAVAGDWHLATTQQIYPLMVTNKAEHIFDAEGNVVFNNPRTVEAYEMYYELFKLSPVGSEAWQWDQPVAAFTEGKVAMIIEKGQYNEQWDLRTTLPPEYLGAAPIPQPDHDGQRATPYWSNALMLTSARPEAVEVYRLLAEFLAEPENAGHLLTAAPGFFLPVTAEAAQSKTLSENPVILRHRANYDLMIEESQYGMLYGFTREPFHLYIGRIVAQELISWTAQRMIHDGLSPAEAVKLGAERMQQAVQ